MQYINNILVKSIILYFFTEKWNSKTSVIVPLKVMYLFDVQL
jgi:hypothetical protein